MHYYVDTFTQVHSKPNWADVAAYEPRKSMPRAEGHRTGLVTESAALVDFFAVGTGARAPTADPISPSGPSSVTTPVLTLSETAAAPSLVAEKPSTYAEVDRIAKQRVQLMAATYARSSDSSEILARLEILNYRLLNQSPRISKAQVDALEYANDQLTQIRASRERQANRLGMSV